jgi:hypothetical protein
MLRLMDVQKTFGFSLESTAYTAETLTAADYNQRVYDVKISPEIESYARKLLRGDYSRDLSISGKRKCTVSCYVDLYPGSAVNVAPQYFAMIRACGYKQTAFGASGISLTPNANYNSVPGTIEVALPQEGLTPDQLVIKAYGCMGKLTVESPQVGQPIKLNFEFTGILHSVSTREFASLIVPTGFDTSLPPAMLAATFSLFGTWQFPSKFTVDSGEVVDLFSDISKAAGYGGAHISDRNMTMTTDPDMVTTTELDLYTDQINNTTGTFSVTIGGGVPIYLSAPTAQIVKGYDAEVREGHIANPLSLELKRGTYGNDEFEILQGAKA